MDNKMQRVDLNLNKDLLRWAAIEAAKIGISRRKFLCDCIAEAKERTNYTEIKIKREYPITPDEAFLFNRLTPKIKD